MNPLFVPELFGCILNCLDSSHPEDVLEGRRALAALARTCSTFSDPSLDHLWRHLDSLIPLMRSFTDVISETRAQVNPLSNYLLRLSRAWHQTFPSPQEWLVINRYAPRIQNLTLGAEMLSINFLERTGLVLPNLKVIRWDDSKFIFKDEMLLDPCYFFVFPRQLLTPRIVGLEVTLRNTCCDSPELLLFLESFTSPCSNLKSFKVNFCCYHSPIPTMQALSRAICRLEDLQHVELPCPIDNVTLRHLGLSSTLRTVSLILNSEMNQRNATWFDPTEAPFRNVTRLALTLWNRFDVLTLLRAHDQAFNTFKVELRDPRTTPMNISAILTAIASPQRIHSLQSVDITQSYCGSVVDVPLETVGGIQEFSHEMCRPITSLVHLRELILSLEYPIAIDDGEFASLVSHWPHLQVFWLTGRLDWSPSKAISLRGLLSLLVSCPELHDIGLSLDTREVPLDDPRLGPGADVCRPRVTRFFVHDFPMQHPDKFEAFLCKHLPSVCLGCRPLVMPSHRNMLSRVWTRIRAWMRTRGRRRDSGR